MDMGKKHPPPESDEHSKFKDLLRKIVAVPKKEADDKATELRDKESGTPPE
jgi:hypothetical protein